MRRSSGEGSNGTGGGGSGYGNLGGGGLNFSGADYLFLYAIPALPLLLADSGFHAQYSRKKETSVVKAFQAHRLPAKVRRKLKPQYFR